MLTDAAPDICAFAAFPQSHWRRIWSTNPLERVNGEIKRRADVAGIFPNEAATLRLVGAVLMETQDEWQITERRYFSEGSMAAIYATPDRSQIPAGLARLLTNPDDHQHALRITRPDSHHSMGHGRGSSCCAIVHSSDCRADC